MDMRRREFIAFIGAGVMLPFSARASRLIRICPETSRDGGVNFLRIFEAASRARLD